MLVSFTLSMPSVRSWNGRWSGEDKIYVRVRDLRSKSDTKHLDALLEKGYFTYRFSDGWVAGIDVKTVTSYEAQKLRAKSAGFSGCDWMIDSLIAKGEIVSSS